MTSQHRCRAVAWPALVALALAACDPGGGSGADDDDDAVAWSAPEGACDDGDRVGAFEAALGDGFTSVQGKVADGVMPYQVPAVVATDGPCRLLEPPELFCDPACSGTETCAAGNTCVPAPNAVSVGTVTVHGLAQPVEMTASAPVYFYTNRGTLDHPGFVEGDEILLVATGEGEVAPFDLSVYGVGGLTPSTTAVSLRSGVAVALAWTAPGRDGLGTVHVNLNISRHGGTPGWIECEVADDGVFELPVALTDALLANGFSGFPALELTRRSVDRAQTAVGCVQLAAQSAAVLDVQIDGLTSCSGDGDCTPPQTCQPDLTCG